MQNKQTSPVILAIAVVVLVAVIGGIGWLFLKPPPTNPSKPPDFIDPATGRPRGMPGPGEGPAVSGPGGRPTGGSGMGPSPIGQRPGGPGGFGGPGGPGGPPGGYPPGPGR